MKKEYVGKVSYDRTSDTGDPSFDFDYVIGYTIAPSIEDLLRYYKDETIKLTITIERIDEEEENE